MSTAAHPEPRELAHRINDGIEVTLLWHGGDRLSVHVVDARTGVDFDMPAPADRALHVFEHPFAFASDELLDTVVA